MKRAEKFEVGDLAIGNKSNYYRLTCEGSIVQVIEVNEDRTFTGAIVYSPCENDYDGASPGNVYYNLSFDMFEKYFPSLN